MIDVRARLPSLFAAALLLLGGAMSAGADQSDPRLGAPFDRPHVPPDPLKARDIDSTSWGLWLR